MKTKENNWNQRHLLGQENIVETIWWSKVMDVLPALPKSKKIEKENKLLLISDIINEYSFRYWN